MLKTAIKDLNDSSTFEVKIIDFGLAKTAEKDEEEIKTATKGLGWVFIAAPEM